MNLTGIIRIKEKVATSKDFTVEEIDFILDAISGVVLLKDPVAVHINMLSGGIAKPSWNNIKHLYPEQFTPSCGCVFCDLDIELHEDEQGFHHVIRGSRFNCTAFKP